MRSLGLRRRDLSITLAVSKLVDPPEADTVLGCRKLIFLLSLTRDEVFGRRNGSSNQGIRDCRVADRCWLSQLWLDVTSANRFRLPKWESGKQTSNVRETGGTMTSRNSTQNR
jgi:hypothetical protein